MQALDRVIRRLGRKRACFIFRKLTENHGGWNTEIQLSDIDVESCTFIKHSLKNSL